MKRIEVNVVAFQEGDVWVAQCVEYDIAAFAKNILDLPKAFERALAANVCANADLGRKAFDGIPQAPGRFRELFENAKFNVTPTQKAVAASTPVRVRDLRLAAA